MSRDDYYDLDCIERDGVTVSCEFLIDAAGLGYLEAIADQMTAAPASSTRAAASDHASVLLKGTKLDLPLWLALVLARRNFVTVTLPSYLSPRFKMSLLADASSVNLADRCASFYGVGAALADQFARNDLRQALQQTLGVRFQHIIEQAQVHATDAAGALTSQTQFKHKLTSNELSIYTDKIDAQLAYRKWKDRDQVKDSVPDRKKQKTTAT